MKYSPVPIWRDLQCKQENDTYVNISKKAVGWGAVVTDEIQNTVEYHSGSNQGK